MTRFLLSVMNAVTILFGALAFLVLFFGIARSMTGDGGIADFALAGALVVVPYCFAGTLHRMLILRRED